MLLVRLLVRVVVRVAVSINRLINANIQRYPTISPSNTLNTRITGLFWRGILPEPTNWITAYLSLQR
jgi:hypothetical protein